MIKTLALFLFLLSACGEKRLDHPEESGDARPLSAEATIRFKLQLADLVTVDPGFSEMALVAVVGITPSNPSCGDGTLHVWTVTPGDNEWPLDLATGCASSVEFQLAADEELSTVYFSSSLRFDQVVDMPEELVLEAVLPLSSISVSDISISLEVVGEITSQDPDPSDTSDASEHGDAPLEPVDTGRTVTFSVVQSKLQNSCSAACHVGAHQFNISEASSIERYFRSILNAVQPRGIMHAYDQEKDVPGEALADVLVDWQRSGFAP